MPTGGHDDVVARRKAALSSSGRVQLEVFKKAFSVGAQLARRRHELNLTQADLSARSGVQQADVSRIEAALAAVRSATSGDDAAAITRASEELQRTSHAMAEALYKARAQAGGGGTAQQPVEPEIVDAEVVEK